MVSPKDSTCENQTGYLTKTSSYQSIDLCVLWNACNLLFCIFGDFYASGMQDAEVTKSLWWSWSSSNCVVPEHIHTTPTEGICCITPPPSHLDFPKKTPKMYPLPPLRNFQNFHTPPGIIAISYQSKKISSFVHYCRFCAFYVFSVKFYNRYANSLCAKVMEKLLNRFLATHKWNACEI